MCGIVGTLNLCTGQPADETTLSRMLAMIRHRGPDQFGMYLDETVGLGSARLSIIDLDSGQQPISNEDGTVWIVFNGEIFNYRELRADLEKRGHQFKTHTDTEVIVHLYEDLGTGCLDKLNGQFAIALWDKKRQTLLLARDRFGITPLFCATSRDTLIFASEIKAIFAQGQIQPEIDPVALDQVFMYWSTLTPTTVFANIEEVPPGHYLLVERGRMSVQPYWQMNFTETPPRPFVHYLSEFRDLLLSSVRLRLRADVPVGAYLSGGLDSSTIAALIRHCTDTPLTTFSISFGDPGYDESGYQQQMAAVLGTEHHVVHMSHADIAAVFPDVIWHTEAPLLRTAPAPMFVLSKLVRDHGFKVVLTGEGADEFLAGYDVFKELQIRRFWAHQPNSTIRPLLLRRLYPYISNFRHNAYLTAFFGAGLMQTDGFDYSHRLRWDTTSRAKRFFSRDLKHALADRRSAMQPVYIPDEFGDWESLSRAQYLEISIFLSQYLLSSQGDRMTMAHSVEGRYPFLDPRLAEFCNGLPPSLKMYGLTEKYLLRKLAREWLPEGIWNRPKQPYRAPIHKAFFHETQPAYVRDLLSPDEIIAVGLFDPGAVSHLVKKVELGLPIGESDDMALAGILSTQLLHHQFVEHFRSESLPVSSDRPIMQTIRSFS